MIYRIQSHFLFALLICSAACGRSVSGNGYGALESLAEKSPASEDQISRDSSVPHSASEIDKSPAEEWDNDIAMPPFEIPELRTHPEVLLNFVDVAKIEEIHLSVPVLEFTLKNADFVRIMRCLGSYPFPVPPQMLYDSEANHQILTDLENQIAEDLLREQLSWGWEQAIFSRQCKIISQRALFGRYEDMTAAHGHFYYVLNPCILDPKDVDSDKAGLCSNRLQLSPIVANEDSGGESQITLRQRYDEARSRVESLLTRLRSLASKIEGLQQVCERDLTRQQSKTNFWNTIGQLTSLGVNSALTSATGGLAGALLSGPVSAAVSNLFGSTSRPPSDAPSCREVQDLLTQGNDLATQYETALSDLRVIVSQIESASAIAPIHSSN